MLSRSYDFGFTTSDCSVQANTDNSFSCIPHVELLRPKGMVMTCHQQPSQFGAEVRNALLPGKKCMGSTVGKLDLPAAKHYNGGGA